MLHITNGHSVIEGFQQACLAGEYLSWVDVLHDGPVPVGLPLEELARVRARFVADAGWATYDGALAEFLERNRRLADFANHEEVVLWFEHDLFDQLQLIEILNWFSGREVGKTKLSMINIGSHPEKPKFTGLGELNAAQLVALLPSRRPVTSAQMEIAQVAWAAFTAADPRALAGLASPGGFREMPFLQPALVRFLEEYPSARNGLSRTQEQILLAAADRPREWKQIYLRSQDAEEAIFMGDFSFLLRLDELASAPTPALSGDRDSGYSLTPLGKALLAGEADWIRSSGKINRWMGGVHLNGAQAQWRWDREKNLLVKG